MKKDRTQLFPQIQQWSGDDGQCAAHLLTASFSVRPMDAGGDQTISPGELSYFCLPTGYFPKCCRQGGTNNPKTFLLTALIILFII